MITAQDKIFDSVYWKPAYDWFVNQGFKENLSLLVIYDSFIHSGTILDFLRKKFSEVPPVKGGNERKWIEEYVTARKTWLAGHSNRILRNTVYRPNCFLKCIADDNWTLDKPVLANGVTVN